MMLSLSTRAVLGAALLAALLPLAPGTARAEPHDLALVFDNSGSMKGNDPGFLARDAAQQFVAGLGDDFRVAIIIFDQSVRLAVPLTPLDGAARDDVLVSLDRVNYRGQYTQTAAALERALYELKTNARDDARRSVVVLTDGIVDTNDKARDLESIRWMRGDLAAEAADQGIRVYGIAFTDNADVMTIQSLAKRTDAEYFRAARPEDVAGAFARVGDLLRAPLPQPAPVAPAPVAAAPADAPESEPAAPVEGAPETDAVTPAVPAAAAPDESAAAAPVPGDAAVEPSGRIALPEAPLPEAPLPDAPLPDTTADTSVAGSGAAATDLAAAAPEAAVGAAGDTTASAPAADVAAAQVADAGAQAPAPAQVPAPQPAGGGTTSWVVVAVGAAALLSVIALVVVLMRRGRSDAAPEPAARPAPASAARVAVPPGAALEDPARATGGTRIPIEQRLVVIGRIPNPAADGSTQSVVVERNTIGRQHASIEYRDNGFWIRDRKSLNGTFVNDRRLEDDEVALRNGDRIRVYDVEFRFELAEQDWDAERTVMAGRAAADEERTVMAGGSAAAAGGAAAATAATLERGLIAAYGGKPEDEPAAADDGAGDARPSASVDEHAGTLMFDATDMEPTPPSASVDEHAGTLMFDAKDLQPTPPSGSAADADDQLGTLIFDAKDHPPIPPEADESDRTVLFGADGGSGDDDEDGDATPIFGDRKKKK